LIERHRIAWHEKTLGQLFCDGSARQIVAMLLDECDRGGVDFALGHPIRDIDHGDARFRVAFGTRNVEAPALVIATGGPSIPKLGATGFAYDLARRFGLKVVEPRPALVPLTLSRDEALFHALSGVSTEVVASAGKAAFREAALFTHRGLSGPAILQVSSYWRPGEPIHIDFLPDAPPGWLREAKRSTPKAGLKTILARHLPERLAETLAERLAGQSGDSHVTVTELANLPDRKLEEAERALSQWRFTPNGTEGFAKAEVTVGGIATQGLSSRTLEARKVPGLYAIGEAVDVTGWLGGYNFQWAWASGVAAGEAV
jgi:predicted Rossmann fold flavoprotein